MQEIEPYRPLTYKTEIILTFIITSRVLYEIIHIFDNKETINKQLTFKVSFFQRYLIIATVFY